jgi:hypothetical protein
MSRLALLSCALGALLACQSNARKVWNHYGAYIPAYGDIVVAAPLVGVEKNVVVNGTITDVCKVKGCWMKVSTAYEDDVFVKFRDYGFFVPRNAAGREVILHGWAQKETMSVEELRHYAQDAGKSRAEIAAITQPQERITFYAEAVWIEGRGLAAPHRE